MRESEFKAPHFATVTASSCVVMERLQGPINPASFIGEHLDVECLNPGFVNTESLTFEGQEVQFSTPGLEEKMPFLQMLQSVECPPLFSYKEPSFQALLKLPYLKKPWDFQPYNYNMPETENQVQTLELESCVTHEIVDLHSPVKSEAKDLHNPHSSSCLEGASPSPEPTQQEPPTKTEPICNEPNSVSSVPWTRPNGTQFTKPSSVVTRERRKRKRTRVTKNKEEVESQRMTHIAVERNRRRQMNDHLNSLRSLMPPSYVQRGDQASIIGGAIDFVKELEQLLHSLAAQKRLRKAETCGTGISSNVLLHCSENAGCEGEAKVKRKSEAAEIEVTAIQNHVNLKVQCRRLPGQLLRAIVALEDLRLTILHLNITSSQASVLYSFNLKIEDDCQLGSADEVASAVHQIFSIINSS